MTCPMHAWPLEAGFDDDFVSTFDAAATNGESLSDKLWVVHLILPFRQIFQAGCDDTQLGMFLLQTIQFRQHQSRSLVLEGM